jgi:hypothetical protein
MIKKATNRLSATSAFGDRRLAQKKKDWERIFDACSNAPVGWR